MATIKDLAARVGLCLIGTLIALAALYLIEVRTLSEKSSSSTLYSMIATLFFCAFLVRPKSPIATVAAGALVFLAIFFMPLILIVVSGFPKPD